MNTNAAEELRKHIFSSCPTTKIRCAIITEFYENVNTSLKTGYTADEYFAFFDALALIRPDEYGYWDIDGTVWYTDGTWSDWVTSDDRSEYWQHCIAPLIPEYLQ